MSTIAINGFVVGSVDAVPSVASALDAYNLKPDPSTEAAYNAAVANALAVATALAPLAGAFFASQAVMADINDIRINKLTLSNATSLIGNVVTLFGDEVEIAGLASMPFTFGVGGAVGFTLGEIVDTVGLFLGLVGLALDSAEISSVANQALVRSLSMTLRHLTAFI